MAASLSSSLSACNVQKVPAGKSSDYQGDARKLVKCGTRNIAVVHYKNRFYAIDNACYHHGGPLFTGDIEDMGGHPCIVCPWHSYRIALDSGEGLYMGIDIPPGGGRPVPSVKSKGCKQRIHPVVVEGDDVFVMVDLSGPAWESDAYANMALANREAPTAAPVHGGGAGPSGGLGLHSGMRSGHVLRHDARMPSDGAFGRAGMNPLAGGDRTGAGTPSSRLAGSLNGAASSSAVRPVCPSGADKRGALYVSCASIDPLCDDVAQFNFVHSSGELQRLPERGEYVALELPIKGEDGKPLVRKWTVCETHHGNSLFTLIVKRYDQGGSGSRWLHQHSLHVPLRVLDVAGTFTLVDHLPRLRQLRGNVLWLTAGIAITSAYAAVGGYLHNHSLTQSTREQLHVLHMHVDRTQKSVAKLDELLQWTRDYSPMALSHVQKHYQLHVFLTHQQPQQVTEVAGMPAAALPFTMGSRLQPQDIQDATENYFAGSPFLCYVCGPPAFIESCAATLLSLGVSEDDILTDDP